MLTPAQSPVPINALSNSLSTKWVEIFTYSVCTECLFHVNEIYINQMTEENEGRKKGPATIEEGYFRSKINNFLKNQLNADTITQ